MSDDDPMRDHIPARGNLAETARELTRAVGALGTAGEGNVANLECRLADLQHRFLSSKAVSLSDIEARLDTIRYLVADLGPRGFLLDLVEATLTDVRDMRSRANRSME
jgi:hypothetical protein